MNLTVERPMALYALALIIPYLWYMFHRFSRIAANLGRQRALIKDSSILSRHKTAFVLRTLLRAIAWSMIVIAFAGVSWGTQFVPVQKNGRAVSLVFDISHSMEAADAPGGMTRLESAARYADMLLEKMPYVSVSVVIAKGDGAVAVPITEDVEAVRTVLTSLSPRLMTAQGSSLGKGIEKALTTFPSHTSQAANIWLFTDGEETDSSLVSSLTQAMRFGVPVSIIGFGSERETTITAGDGITQVKTALRSQEILKAIETAKTKGIQTQSNLTSEIRYIDASEVGSANTLLSSINGIRTGTADSGDQSVIYEIHPIDRHAAFLLLAIACIAASFVFGELTITKPKSIIKKASLSALVASTVIFTGCSAEKIRDGAKILEGRLEWNQKNYQNAVAHFMQVEESAEARGDEQMKQYAVYGLATTYLMQNENEAAKERFDSISSQSEDSIRFAVLYNNGILYHRNGDYNSAANCFKEALMIDSTNLNAKINLELSQKEAEAHSKTQEQQLTPISENTEEHSSLENALYSTIRENEQKQWKNQQQESESSALDY